MEQIERRIIEAQEAINHCRNEITAPSMNGYRRVVGHRKPGDPEYLPPVTDFVTISFKHGFVTMPAEEFQKMPKTKAKKLMKV